MKFIQGAMVTSAWLSFYEYTTLNVSVCAELFDLVAKYNYADHKNSQNLFMFVRHESSDPKISIYSYNNYVVY